MIVTWSGYRSWNSWKSKLLVLARRINESIMIGDDIEVVIVDIKGDQIKLGIRAPKNVSVHRSEIFKEIKDQNRQAANSAPQSIQNARDLIEKKKKK